MKFGRASLFFFPCPSHYSSRRSRFIGYIAWKGVKRTAFETADNCRQRLDVADIVVLARAHESATGVWL